MRTYPIFEVLFIGSDLHPAITAVRVSADTFRHAVDKLVAMQEPPMALGPIGRWDDIRSNYVPDRTAIRMLDLLRATTSDFLGAHAS